MQPFATKKSLRGSLVRLNPGEQLTISVEKVESVRSLASTLGLSLNRKYSTRTDRQSGSITITRIY